MVFPLDIVSWAILFAVISIILLLASELLDFHANNLVFLMDKKRLGLAGVAFSLLFLITMFVYVVTVIMHF